MNIQNGYFYFIKDLFFDKFQEKELMQNKNNGNKRPAFYCFKDKNDSNILWFVPISSNVKKYRDIFNNKIQKQRLKYPNKIASCDTLVFGKVSNKDSAFLIQNMFPVIDKYIIGEYTKQNKPVTISPKVKAEIETKAHKVLSLVNKGYTHMVYSDIKKIYNMEKNELLNQIKIEDIFNNKKLTFADDFEDIVNSTINKEDLHLYLNYIEDSSINQTFENILNNDQNFENVKNIIINEAQNIFYKIQIESDIKNMKQELSTILNKENKEENFAFFIEKLEDYEDVLNNKGYIMLHVENIKTNEKGIALVTETYGHYLQIITNEEEPKYVLPKEFIKQYEITDICIDISENINEESEEEDDEEEEE